jgi:hypothetical protein
MVARPGRDPSFLFTFRLPARTHERRTRTPVGSPRQRLGPTRRRAAAGPGHIVGTGSSAVRRRRAAGVCAPAAAH